jgi:hypothetical protein
MTNRNSLFEPNPIELCLFDMMQSNVFYEFEKTSDSDSVRSNLFGSL